MIFLLIGVIFIIIILIYNKDNNPDNSKLENYKSNWINQINGNYNKLSEIEKSKINTWLNVVNIIPCERKTGKAIVFSLFAKHSRYNDKTQYISSTCNEITYLDKKYPVTEEGLKSIYIKHKKNTFWNHYIESLFLILDIIKNKIKDYKARIYLAQDLIYLIPKFPKECTEIYIMEGCSYGYVGTLWRFLALNDHTLDIAISYDADAGVHEHVIDELKNKITSSEKMYDKNKKFMRIRHTCQKLINETSYTAIGAGGITSYPKRIGKEFNNLLIDFLSTTYEKNENTARNKFPFYSIDEIFLTHIVYYYYLNDIVTYCKNGNKKHWNNCKDCNNARDYRLTSHNWVFK